MRGRTVGTLLAAMVLAFGGMAVPARADQVTFYADVDKLTLRKGETATIDIGMRLDAAIAEGSFDVFIQIKSNDPRFDAVSLGLSPVSAQQAIDTFSMKREARTVLSGQSLYDSAVIAMTNKADGTGKPTVLEYFSGENASYNANEDISIASIVLTLEDPLMDLDAEPWDFEVSFFVAATGSGALTSGTPVFVDSEYTPWSVATLDYRVNGVSQVGTSAVTITVTPEPATWATLAGFGLVGMAWYRRRYR